MLCCTGGIASFIHFHIILFPLYIFKRHCCRPVWKGSKKNRQGQVWTNRPNKLTRLPSKSAAGSLFSSPACQLLPLLSSQPQDFFTLHSNPSVNILTHWKQRREHCFVLCLGWSDSLKPYEQVNWCQHSGQKELEKISKFYHRKKSWMNMSGENVKNRCGATKRI